MRSAEVAAIPITQVRPGRWARSANRVSRSASAADGAGQLGDRARLGMSAIGDLQQHVEGGVPLKS